MVHTGWWGLVDVYRQRAYERAAEADEPPRACPNDGEPLDTGLRTRHCRFDGWTPHPDDRPPDG